MAKPNYIVIAEVLKDIRENQYDNKYNTKDVWISIFAGSIAQELEKINPKFNKDRFYNTIWS
jgi:hypothetical protein